jgi:hypothetical protein
MNAIVNFKKVIAVHVTCLQGISTKAIVAHVLQIQGAACVACVVCRMHHMCSLPHVYMVKLRKGSIAFGADLVMIILWRN